MPFDGQFRSLMQITEEHQERCSPGRFWAQRISHGLESCTGHLSPPETTTTCLKSLEVSLAQPCAELCASICSPGPWSGMYRGAHARGITWAVAVPGQTQATARSLLFSHHPSHRSRSNAERKGSSLDASQKLKFSSGGRKQQQHQALE